MTTDAGLAAVREARTRISREFDNDVAKLLAHYRELQEGYSGRVIRGPETAAQQALAPDEDLRPAARASGPRR